MDFVISRSAETIPVTPELEDVIASVLSKAAEVYGLKPETEVSVLLTDNMYIQQLNCQYRAKDLPTDVLSFALNEGEEPDIIDGPDMNLLGDIIISLDMAKSQAREYGHSLEREVAYLTVHGMLHLLGYDHEAETDKSEMRQEEEHILSLLGITRLS